MHNPTHRTKSDFLALLRVKVVLTNQYPGPTPKAKKANHIGDVSFVEQNSKKDNVKVRVPEASSTRQV